MSSPISDLLFRSEAFDLGSSTRLPLTLANRLCPEETLNSSYKRKTQNAPMNLDIMSNSLEPGIDILKKQALYEASRCFPSAPVNDN